MSARKLSRENEDLLSKLEMWLGAREDERADLRQQLATVRDVLKAADADKAAETKRADEAEARLANLRERLGDEERARQFETKRADEAVGGLREVAAKSRALRLNAPEVAAGLEGKP